MIEMNKNVNFNSHTFASNALKLDITLFQYLTTFMVKHFLLASSQNFLYSELYPLPPTCPHAPPRRVSLFPLHPLLRCLLLLIQQQDLLSAFPSQGSLFLKLQTSTKPTKQIHHKATTFRNLEQAGLLQPQLVKVWR